MVKAEEKARHSVEECHQKQNQLVAAETELRHTKRSQEHLESERSQLKQQVEQLNSEVRRLNATNASIQRQLDLENKTVNSNI